jgi:hypothetical protein
LPVHASLSPPLSLSNEKGAHNLFTSLREREREIDRETERQRDRETERKRKRKRKRKREREGERERENLNMVIELMGALASFSYLVFQI